MPNEPITLNTPISAYVDDFARSFDDECRGYDEEDELEDEQEDEEDAPCDFVSDLWELSW
jgi:hypothetical protein